MACLNNGEEIGKELDKCLIGRAKKGSTKGKPRSIPRPLKLLRKDLKELLCGMFIWIFYYTQSYPDDQSLL